MIFKRKETISNIILLDESTEKYHHSPLWYFRTFQYIEVLGKVVCGVFVSKSVSSSGLLIETFSFPETTLNKNHYDIKKNRNTERFNK